MFFSPLLSTTKNSPLGRGTNKMAAATAIHVSTLESRKLRRLSCVTCKIRPPIFISTNPTQLNLQHLNELYLICNQSSHQFPNVSTSGKVDPVDFFKLCTAVAHSSIVVTAFTKPEFLMSASSSSNLNDIGGDWIKKLMPVTPENGQLVGFGRAVSDCALTASIYDVMVHPALQGRGIGRLIVQSIIRKLTSNDIYDISALCSNKQRLFFGACGFGDDMLKSTTMMYSRAPVNPSGVHQVISAGRKLLILPPKREASL